MKTLYTLETLAEFIKENGRAPSAVKEEMGLYRWIKRNKELIEEVALDNELFQNVGLLDKNENKKEKHIEEIVNFIKKNGKMPRSGVAGESALYSYYYKNREECLKNEIIRDIVNSKKSPKEAELISFVEENGIMPRGNVEVESHLYVWFTRNKEQALENKAVKEAYLKPRKREMKYSVEDLFDFVNENGRLPSSTDKNESGFYQWFARNREECLAHSFIRETYNKQ